VKIARAHWASGSFLLYLGGLLALAGAVAWMSVIAAQHGEGAFAGWSVLFWAVAEFLALWFLMQGRRITAGVFAFVALGMWAAFAYVVDTTSWAAGFALASIGPFVGWYLLGRLPEISAR